MVINIEIRYSILIAVYFKHMTGDVHNTLDDVSNSYSILFIVELDKVLEIVGYGVH